MKEMTWPRPLIWGTGAALLAWMLIHPLRPIVTSSDADDRPDVRSAAYRVGNAVLLASENAPGGRIEPFYSGRKPGWWPGLTRSYVTPSGVDPGWLRRRRAGARTS